MNDLLYTQDGMLRIRWWPMASLLILGAVWLLPSATSIVFAAFGSESMILDPFWHAPLIMLRAWIGG